MQHQKKDLPLHLAIVLTNLCLPEPIDPVRSSIGMIGLEREEDNSSEIIIKMVACKFWLIIKHKQINVGIKYYSYLH